MFRAHCAGFSLPATMLPVLLNFGRKNGSCEGKRYAIGDDDNAIPLEQAIQQPKQQSRAEHQVGGQGYAIGLSCADGLNGLRHK